MKKLLLLIIILGLSVTGFSAKAENVELKDLNRFIIENAPEPVTNLFYNGMEKDGSLKEKHSSVSLSGIAPIILGLHADIYEGDVDIEVITPSGKSILKTRIVEGETLVIKRKLEHQIGIWKVNVIPKEGSKGKIRVFLGQHVNGNMKR